MRLIDADDFYNKMNDLSKIHQGIYNGAINDCMNLLDEQPTAYDISKVVVELEELKTPKCSVTKTETLITKACVNRAIDIVRKGGVE